MKRVLTAILLLVPLLTTAKVIKLGVDQWPPYSVVSDDFIGGIDIDVVKYIANQIDHEIEIILCPWKRCLRMIEKGDVDMLTSLLRNKEREQFIDFLSPAYYVSNKVFYVLANSDVVINSYQNLEKLIIGTGLGQINDDTFDNDKRLRKIPIVNEEKLIDMLIKKRVDTFLSVENYADYIIEHQGLTSTIQKSSFRFGSTKAHMGLSKKSHLKSQLSELNALLKEMVNGGIVDNITQQVAQGKGENFHYLTNNKPSANNL